MLIPIALLGVNQAHQAEADPISDLITVQVAQVVNQALAPPQSPIEVKPVEEPKLPAAPPPAPANDVQGIIREVFGFHGEEAIRVARCESGFRTSARNGQYYGIFQMGNSERATYGGSSSDPREQIEAAHRYFVAAHGWGPWECKP